MSWTLWRWPATDYQHYVYLQNTFNWLSASCPPSRTAAPDNECNIHLQNTSNWISVSYPLWEHQQLIISVISTFITQVTDYQHYVHFENTFNWSSVSCPQITSNWLWASSLPWEHSLIISVMSTLRTPATDNQRHAHFENTLNWLSASCPH